MPISTDNLFTMQGRVRNARPNVKAEQSRTWINDAIRNVINMRTYWADLGARKVISIPDAISTGTVSVTRGSAVAVGVGTGWATDDLVNTTLTSDVSGSGYERVTLASAANIDANTTLLFDQGTASEESVALRSVNGLEVLGTFRFAHNSGCTVTASSMQGRQLRMGRGYPIFTIRSVPTATTLELDNPWGDTSLVDSTYSIILMYVITDPWLRRHHNILDQKQGLPLDFKSVTRTLLDQMDPQRSSTGNPRLFVPFMPSASGNMWNEIWPAPTSARQIDVFYSRQWPELVNPEDVPPPFLESTIFTDLASAVALRTRMAEKDPYYDPKNSDWYFATARGKVEHAVNNDEDRHSSDYEHHTQQFGASGNYNWHQNHCIEAIEEGF